MSTNVTLGDREYFPGIPRIPFEGPDSDNPLAFKHYNENRVIAGRPMRDHFRFSVAYWHSFCGTGSDPFGLPTRRLPWSTAADPMAAARERLDAAFEFVTKLGVPFYCFHDQDLAPEGRDIRESDENLQEMVKRAKDKQTSSGVRLLWGTANLFSHPRYMNGAATNPDFRVVAHAAGHVKSALDTTIELGGEHYVFGGGREGYLSLLNTDMKREADHLGTFPGKARDYGRERGFTGSFLIEPKPLQPSKHQNDYDSSTVIAFLQRHDLDRDFKLNIENNHATLAGHSFAHEIQVAADAGLFGSLDVNQGDPHNGWDTDEFLHNLYDTVEIMLVILSVGGLTTGGMNFDAKVRRNSTDLEDLFIGHIVLMDALARALLIAERIRQDSDYFELKRERYASFDDGHGAEFERGDLGLEQLSRLAAETGEPEPRTGKQEYLEGLVNRFLR